MINYLVGIEETEELLHTGMCVRGFLHCILFDTHFLIEFCDICERNIILIQKFQFSYDQLYN